MIMLTEMYFGVAISSMWGIVLALYICKHIALRQVFFVPFHR